MDVTQIGGSRVVQIFNIFHKCYETLELQINHQIIIDSLLRWETWWPSGPGGGGGYLTNDWV